MNTALMDHEANVVQDIWIHLNPDLIRQGIVPTKRVTPKGTRNIPMGIEEFSRFIGEIYEWENEQRGIQMVSRFDRSGLIAYGQNGQKWQAVKEIQSSCHYLLSPKGLSYFVEIPRLVVAVTNHAWPYFYWTDEKKTLKKTSKLYPLLIGNVYRNGRVCLGTTGLRCAQLKDIDLFVKKVIEAASTTDLAYGRDLDVIFEGLTLGWDDQIGKKNGFTMDELLETAFKE